jgi:hypothetical protein
LLTVNVDGVFPLEDVGAAFDLTRSGHPRSKFRNHALTRLPGKLSRG